MFSNTNVNSPAFGRNTARFDVYSVARPSILHRSTSAAVPFLCAYGNGHRGCVSHSRGFYETMESWWRSTRDWAVNPCPNRFDEIQFRAGNKHRAVFTSKEVGLYVVSSLIRRFRWPHTVTRLRYERHVVAAPNRITARNLAMHTRVCLVGNTISINVHGLYTRKTKDRSIFDNSI